MNLPVSILGIAITLAAAPESTDPAAGSRIDSGVLAMDRVLAGAVALAATGAVFHALLNDHHSFASSVAGSTWVAVALTAIGTALTWAYVRDPGAPVAEDPHHMHHRRFHL